MNKHKQPFQAALALSSLLAASVIAFPVQAQQSPGHAYAGATGTAVQSAGECMRTSSWSKENATKECNPELFPEPKVVVQAPKPAPVAKPEPKPEPKPVVAPPPPAPKVVTFGAAALFAVNKADLTPAGQKALEQYREQARAQLATATSVKITGHTDSTGSPEYNQKLSVRRAEAVRDYLVKLGANANIMQVSGMGESKPIADNKTAEGRAKNRRVEVEVTGTAK